jgi:ABC-type sugar transport system ATPase subunit
VTQGRAVSANQCPGARRHGVDSVSQDLALVHQLPVYRSLFLHREIVCRRLHVLDEPLAAMGAKEAA